MQRFARALAGSRLTALALATVLATACGGVETSGFGGDVQTLLARGEAYVRDLPRQPVEVLTDEDLVALSYLERARLGLGSPFRLVDYVLRDPGLGDDTAERLAYGILALTLEGRTYEVDPAVLESARFFGVPPWVPTGAAQLDLIARTIRAAPSPASGERAVRLAYRIAEAERSLAAVPHPVVAQVAALLADGHRAAADADDLLRTAGAAGVDPLVLLQEWRSTRRFRVESPSLVPLSVGEEAAVALSAPRMAQGLESLALRLGSRGFSPVSLDTRIPVVERFVEGAVADRLLALTAARDYPPQPPVAVPVAIARDRLVNSPDLAEWERRAREAFADAAYNEERLVAAAAALRESGAAESPRLPLIELQVAAFLRGWGQEEPWFPGDPAPAAKDLIGRFGLAAIDFDRGVPDAWRPYSLRVVGRALSDLQRVLPTASVRGLTIRIGPLPSDRRALALHDPRTRTLYLPPASAAGTLAHEIAHDLDWQMGRQRYGTRGAYATDLSVRSGRGDRIATSLRDLSAAFRRPGPDTLIDHHDTRPAEVFARGADWFIAAALAREGRTAGYLSSFQDPALTGYGSTRGPDIGGAAVPSLLVIFDAIAPVAEETRRWAQTELGPVRTLSPSELAGAVLHAGRELPPRDRLMAIAEARDRSLSVVSTASCRVSSTRGMRELAAAQRQLVLRSTAAAARGTAIEAIRELASDRLGARGPAVEQWLAWRLYGAPEPADSALVELAPAFEDILSHAELIARERPLPTGTAFRPSGPIVPCGQNPFAPASGSAPAFPSPERSFFSF